MRVPWPDTRCILCLKHADLTIEHLVPKALGGVLTCRFVCPGCNSLLGASFEASARADPSIRLAVDNLRNKMPRPLVEKLTEKQPYIAKSLGGKERGQLRGGRFRIRSRQAEDGSVIPPTDDARKSLERMLRKSGSGLAIEDMQLDLRESRPMSSLVPLKIAFEFIAVISELSSTMKRRSFPSFEECYMNKTGSP